ncbi:hypothetical protein ONS96_008549 [Cadophora gregata f. sp. sojae]|nr:hypothetical protein ONS96_008549 [Cadophora gregata f. sp. sojae]
MASTTELYHHAPFTDVRSIRLLFLQPGQFDDVINVRLKVFSLDDLPPYCALSYAWGPPPHTTPVSCYGKKLLASESCVAALRRLRDTIEEKVLWIDAICIDQTSLSERGHQVNLMCGVYSKAERTWIWLGESTPETDFMIDFLGDYHKVLDATKDYFPGSTDNLLLLEIEKLKAEERRLYGVECATLFDLLIGKPWFCRVWTVQEYTLSRDSRIICGSKQMPISYIFEGWVSILKIRPSNGEPNYAPGLPSYIAFATHFQDV